ncbi:hypothetical protein [Microbacterium sp. MYb45]|uniref:hypothetical protein n=1 Tax=Microbacterium sp. MYb45 TaxID=1827294 RepID=UPI000CFE54E7|nr:hypothetical protein [Microbacterium sp. MYb45]PRB57304.1 hypothetical protein CQ034_18045 [Microbacterium sp. MYb45]
MMNDRRRVERLFEELEAECGTSVECLADRVSALTGMDVEIDVLADEEWMAVAPFVLAEGDRVRIPVRGSDPRWFRLHVVTHELAHVLCGHARCETLPMAFDQLMAPARSCALAGVGGGSPGAVPSAISVAEYEAEAEELSLRLSAFVRAPSLAHA